MRHECSSCSGCDLWGQEITYAQERLIQLFDSWYGDKAYREHDMIAAWAAEITRMSGVDSGFTVQ